MLDDESDECTTDALPSPPRTKKKYPSSDNKSKSKVSETDEVNEDYEETSSAQARLNQAVIYIRNSTQVHVGDIKYYGNGKSEPSHRSPIRETEKIQSLKISSKPVSTRDIELLSQHLSPGWEVTARALGYSDGEIYKFEYKYNFRNLTQTLYDLLKDWIEYKGPKATVGILAQTLWNTKQKEALKLWSEHYEEEIH